MDRSATLKLRPVRVSTRLMLGTALVGTAALLANTAQAQNEQVVVTGTSIRGVQPVGAAVINIDRTTIEETAASTTSELLTNVPQITGASGGFGSSGQRNEGGGGALSSPNIHSLGTQASTATLVLIDGHIIAPSGQSTNVVDPSVIPAVALQRVDVLPDGASAIYGANAVAGVVNFITRRDFTGWETRVQAGMADHYSTFSASQLFGHAWDTGSVMAAYSYSSRSNLFRQWRDFMTARQDIRLGAMTPEQQALFNPSQLPAVLPAGKAVSTPAASVATAGSAQYAGMPIPYPSIGTNFQNFNCPVAAISRNTSSTNFAFLYPYTPDGINSVTVGDGSGGTMIQSGYRRTGSPSQGVCDQQDYSSDLISSLHNNVIIAFRQSITDNILLHVDLVRGSHNTTSHQSRGSVSATVFNPAGTGGPTFGASQVNPFYVPVPGHTGDTSEYITFNFDELLGPGAYSEANNVQSFAAVGLDMDLGGNWGFSLNSTFSQSESITKSNGSVVTAQAALALNGTTSTSGNEGNALSDPYALGSVVSVTRALTSANALDVWNPKDTNRTSAAVLRSLTDNSSGTTVYNNLIDVVAKVDGPLPLDLGAGPIKSAFGVDYYHLNQPQYRATNNGVGPSSTSSRGTTWAFNRTAYAAFAELLVPLVNEDMGIPLVQNLTLDVSGRYDSFSDFGDTKNPKVSLSWGLVDGLLARGTFSTSFVAPNVHDVGGPEGVNSQTSVRSAQIASNRIIPFYAVNPLPYSQGPFTARGVGTQGTIVENATSCLALNSVTGLSPTTAAVVNIDGGVVAANDPAAYGCRLVTNGNGGFAGLRVGGAKADLRPERGLTYSAGIDFDAGRLWDVLEGLSGSVTYYNTKFIDVITNQQVENNIPEATSFAPACGTGSTSSTPGTAGCLPGWDPNDPIIQNLIATRPLDGALPSRIYTMIDLRIQNPFTIWQAGFDFSIAYRHQTDNYGTFTWSMNGNQVIRFSQKPNSSIAPLLDINDCKNSARYCTSEFAGSTRLGWRMDAYSAGITFNYMHAFNVPNNSYPWSLPSDPNGPARIARYQHIGSLQTIDLNLGYTLPEDWLDGTSLSLTVSNLLDTPPPFYDSTNGFSVGSEIGRLISFGIVKKW